jgi:hypothetical protein
MQTSVGLLGLDLDGSVALDVLAPDPRPVADPEPRVEERRVHLALHRSLQIGGLEMGEVVVGKRRVPRLFVQVEALRDREPLHPVARAGL